MEMLSYPFMQRAFAAGIVLGIVASYYGVFIVQKKMSFLGTGLSHSALAGVAIGMFLSINPTLTAIPYTIVMSVLIIFLRNKSKVSADTAIGIVLSFSVAAGIIIMTLREDNYADAFSYLFGSILTVNVTDVYVTIAILLISLMSMPFLWRKWAYIAFDTELARADKLRVSFHDYLLAIMTALAIAAAIKITGIILITSFLILPAAAAQKLSGTFLGMTLLAIILGVISVIAGLVMSYFWDLPSGAVIVMSQVLIFILMLIIKIIVK